MTFGFFRRAVGAGSGVMACIGFPRNRGRKAALCHRTRAMSSGAVWRFFFEADGPRRTFSRRFSEPDPTHRPAPSPSSFLLLISVAPSPLPSFPSLFRHSHHPFVIPVKTGIQGRTSPLSGPAIGVGAKADVTSGFVSMFRSFDKLGTPQAQHIAGSTNLGVGRFRSKNVRGVNPGRFPRPDRHCGRPGAAGSPYNVACAPRRWSRPRP